MTDRTVETSPQLYARVGGALYLIIIVIGLFGEAFVRDKLIVSGDANATAKNIMASESLWRLHIVAELFLLICAVVLLMILFVLLRPVSRELTLLAAFFNLVSIGLEAATTMYLVVALFPPGECRVPQNICPGTALRHDEPVAQIAWLWLWREPALLRLFLRCHRPRDLPVRLPSQGYRRFDADRRFVPLGRQFRSCFGSRPCQSVVPRHSCSCFCGGGLALPLASCEGRERTTMEGASKRRGLVD